MGSSLKETRAILEAAVRSGDFASAERKIRDAIAADASDRNAWTMLVKLQETTNDLIGLSDTLARIDELSPGHADILLQLSWVRAALGDKTSAQEILDRGRALHPLHPAFAIRRAVLKSEQDPQAAIAEVRKFMKEVLDSQAADAPRRALQAHETLFVLENRAARRRAGKRIRFAESWEDAHGWEDRAGLLEYETALSRLIATPGVDYATVLNAGAVALLKYDWVLADRYFAELKRQPRSQVSDLMTFDAQVWSALAAAPEATFGGLVPVEPVVQDQNAVSAPFTLLLASDPVYFRKFTVPLLRSLRVASGDVHVQVHLLDGEPEEWKALAAEASTAYGGGLTVTAERSGARSLGAKAKSYYHAVRFIRFYQFLAASHRPLWMMDVDAAFQHDPAPHFSRLRDVDVALWFEAGALEPWAKQAAGLIGGSGSPASLAYFRLTAAFIMSLWKESRIFWGIDQLALYGTSVHLLRTGQLPRTWFLDEVMISHLSSSPSAIIDFAAGAKKYAGVTQITPGAPSPNRR